MSDLDPLARSMVDAHRRAVGGGVAGEGAANARAELVAALADATSDDIGDALASAAGSVGLFKDVLAALIAAVDASTACPSPSIDVDCIGNAAVSIAARALSLARPAADEGGGGEGAPSTSGAIDLGANPDPGGLGAALVSLVSLAPSNALVALVRAGVEAMEACRPPGRGEVPRPLRASLAAAALPGLDLATAALARLAEEGDGDGGDGSSSPTTAAATALVRICRAPTWPAPAARAVEALRSVPRLTPAQAGAVSDRALAECVSAGGPGPAAPPAPSPSSVGDLTDLPAVLHQLLLLRPACAARTALDGAVDLLDAASGGPAAAWPSPGLAATAATVVLEAERAAAAAPAAARAWLPGLAARAASGPHGAAVLLAIAAGVPRLSAPALDEVRAALGRAYKADGLRARSRWAAGASVPAASTFPPAAAVEAALLAVAAGKAAGWERGLPAVLTLADTLIEDVKDGDKAAGGGGGGDGGEPTDAPGSARGGRLAVRLLVAAFGSAPTAAARGQVLHLCIGRLAATGAVTGGGGGGGGGDASVAVVSALPPSSGAPLLAGRAGHWVAALAGIASAHAADLASTHAGAVRAALELCGGLPSSTGCALLAALWPAARRAGPGGHDARDAAALSLRKAAFAREAGSRAAAARGMLLLALHELQGGGGSPDPADDVAGPSQAPPTQAGRGGGAAASTTASASLQELTGFLRRCLSQQAGVRAALYDGLPSLVAADGGAGPTTDAVAGLLLAQLAKVGRTGGDGSTCAGPPLRLDVAVPDQPGGEAAVVVEPVAALLGCVRRVCLLAGAPPAPARDGIAGPHGRAAARVAARLPPAPPAPPHAAGPVARLAAAFAAVKAGLLTSVVEHYSLDKAAGWDGPCAAVPRARGRALQSALEVCMADALAGAAGGGCGAGQAADELAAAFRLHDRLRELGEQGGGGGPARPCPPAGPAGDAGAAAPKKRGREAGEPPPSDAGPPPPALSPGCVAGLLRVAAEDRLPSPDGSAPQDGPPPGAGDAPSAAPGALSLDPGARLAREPRFQAFALRAAAGVLAPGRGCAGGASTAARAVLARPLLAAAAMVALAYAPSTGRGSGGGGAGAAPAAASAIDGALPGLAVDAMAALLGGAASRDELRALLTAADAGCDAGGGEYASLTTDGGGDGGDGDGGEGGADPRPRPLHPSSWALSAGRVLDRLASHGAWKQVGTLADALSRLGRAPGVLSPSGRAALRLSAEGVAAARGAEAAPAAVARALAGLLLATAPGPGGDAAEAGRLACLAVASLQPPAAAAAAEGGGEPAGPPGACALVTAPRGAAAVAAAALDFALTALTDVDAALAVSRAAGKTAAAAPPPLARRLMNGGGGGGGGGDAAAASAAAASAAAAALDSSIAARLDSLLPPIAAVAGGSVAATAPPSARLGDKALRAVLAAYRALAGAAARAADAAKQHQAGGGGGGAAPPSSPALSPAFLAMVATAHKSLAPAAYSVLYETENVAVGGGGGGNAGGGNGSGGRAPLVVFAAEDFERRLLRLGRGSAGAGAGGAALPDLLRGARRATARDFRINAGVLAAVGGGGGASV